MLRFISSRHSAWGLLLCAGSKQAPARTRMVCSHTLLSKAPRLSGAHSHAQPNPRSHITHLPAALHPQRGCHIASARSSRDILCSGHPHPLRPQGAIDPLIQAAAFCLLEGPLERLLHLTP